MIDDRLSLALGRLERAVSRLETHVSSRSAAPVDAADEDVLPARFAQLEERHEALRLRTSAAVERLNQLLDTARGD